MDTYQSEAIAKDRFLNGLSYRTLGKKYKIGTSAVYRIIMSNQRNQEKPPLQVAETSAPEPLPDDVERLKEALRKAHLKIELQDLMLDISSKELGLDLRKKHGTRQSK